MNGITDTFMQRYLSVDLTALEYVPDGKVEESEVESVLGVANDKAKKVYQVLRWATDGYNEAVRLLGLEEEKNSSGDVIEAIRKEICQLDDLYKAAEILFWAEVKDQFNKWFGDECIVIKEGWQVVSKPKTSGINIVFLGENCFS